MENLYEKVADRVVHDHEYQKLIDAIEKKGGMKALEAINSALAKHRYELVDGEKK